VASLRGSGITSCVAARLTPGWAQFSQGLGSVSDPSVSMYSLQSGLTGIEVTAFTISFSALQDRNFPIYTYTDVVFLRRGQEDALLTFTALGSPFDLTLEQRLERVFIKRLDSLRLVYLPPVSA
jgi:hypothetical protein